MSFIARNKPQDFLLFYQGVFFFCSWAEYSFGVSPPLESNPQPPSAVDADGLFIGDFTRSAANLSLEWPSSHRADLHRFTTSGRLPDGGCQREDQAPHQHLLCMIIVPLQGEQPPQLVMTT